MPKGRTSLSPPSTVLIAPHTCQWTELSVLFGASALSLCCWRSADSVLHSEQMRNAITVRLPEELADWLESAAASAGVSQGKVIRDQLEKARAREDRPFLRLAGKVSASATLSSRKGFSKK